MLFLVSFQKLYDLLLWYFKSVKQKHMSDGEGQMVH